MKTKAELVVQFKGHTVTIPAGTRCTTRCADGSNRTDGRLFVDDLSFINPRTHGMLLHDATYYGIDVDAAACERALTFEQATGRFRDRFTMEHVPAWSRLRPTDHGGTETRYYAPQFRSDREWYDNTRFHGEPGHIGTAHECTTTGQTWPLGQWLDGAYTKGFGS